MSSLLKRRFSLFAVAEQGREMGALRYITRQAQQRRRVDMNTRTRHKGSSRNCTPRKKRRKK